jgi:hypothetical protein
MSYNEANTRKELIDKALEKVGWNPNESIQVGLKSQPMGMMPNLGMEYGLLPLFTRWGGDCRC